MKTPAKTSGPGLWKEHSEAWKASGLTQEAYCEQEGISYNSFVYQHNRLTSEPKKTPLHFIEAKLRPVPMSSQSSLQLLLPNGIRIDIGTEFNSAVLQRVLSVAGAVPCLS